VSIFGYRTQGPLVCTSCALQGSFGTVPGMIGHLTGIVIRPGVINVSGVGYDVHYLDAYPLGSEVSLFITSVWGHDGGLTLYGFETADEQAMFTALCRVPKIGAIAALSLLRTHGAGGVAEKVVSNDPDGLAKAPSVGRKTAEHIIAMIVLPEGLDGAGTRASDPLVDALVSLGFSESVAGASVAVARSEGSTDESVLLRVALSHARQS
jgi:Holliday junction resolvasome RuvABC DNA-binding subunit